MRTNLPVFQSVYGQWGSALVQTFYYRTQPNPNQAGSPGTLPNLTGVLFTASLLDMYDQPVSAVPDLATYISGGTGGAINLVIPSGTLSQIPAGTYRYRIAMVIGTAYQPVFSGPFLVAGDAPAVTIAAPGSSSDDTSGSDSEFLVWGP